MSRKSTVSVPEAITQLQRQLEQFRSTRPARTKLPESLWQLLLPRVISPAIPDDDACSPGKALLAVP
jgi:hypothetical protein